MQTDIKAFNPITREEAERIIRDVKRGHIEGATSRDAAFFIYAHGRLNPGKRFAYTIRGTGGEQTRDNPESAIQILQIETVVFGEGRYSYGVTVRELAQ